LDALRASSPTAAKACSGGAGEAYRFCFLTRYPASLEIARFSISASGLVSRVTPVQTAKRNCTRDEGGPFEFGNQVLISNHRKLLSPKATVVNVAEVSGI